MAGRKAKDLTGRRFGKLVALSRTGDKSNAQGVSWVCRCDCGAVKQVRSGNMLGGNVVSCGDYSKHPVENLDDDHSASATFVEIAKAIGVSRQRARNIYEMALAKVRNNPELMVELKEYL